VIAYIPNCGTYAPPAITGITGAAFEAGGEGAATAGEGFAFGVGIAKFGFDALTFGYGYYKGCTP
jgi:hypothetical protein